MKILAIHSTWERNGSTLNLGFVTKVLVNSGHQVYILNRFKENGSIFLEKCGGKLIYFGFPLKMNTTIYLEKSNPSLGRILIQNSKEPLRFILGFLITLYYILKIRPNVLFLADSTFPQCLIAGKLLNIKIIGEIQAELIEGKLGIRRNLIIYLYKKCDVLFGITESIMSPLLNANKINKDKLMIIPNTIELELNRDKSEADELKIDNENYKIISFFGGSDEKKGFYLFMEIVKKISMIKDNILFLLVGSIDKEAKYFVNCNKSISNDENVNTIVDFIKKYNLDKKLLIYGERDDILMIMKQSNVVLVPYKLPHFARPIIESFSVKTPVIASDNEFNREVIKDGINGCLIDYENLDKWVKTINKLLDDTEFANNLAENGYKTYLGNFNPQVISEKIKLAFGLN